MVWADLISAGTADGRSSGSVFILLALRRPTMQPSHLPTLPVQRHMACRQHPHLFSLFMTGSVRPPCRAVSARCQRRWRGHPRRAFIVSSHSRAKDVCVLMRSEDPEAKSHMGDSRPPGHSSSPATHGGTSNTALPIPNWLSKSKKSHACGLPMERSSSMPRP